MHNLHLRKTELGDLDYVLQAEGNEDNRQYIIPWTREQHLQAIAAWYKFVSCTIAT